MILKRVRANRNGRINMKIKINNKVLIMDMINKVAILWRG
jgi:hypothetical protein